jgi:mono/diheme cytochrome c family protein
MPPMRHSIIALSSLSSLIALTACDGGYPQIKEPLKLAGNRVISAEQLSHGRDQYTLYCRPCHGDKGDGRGPAGIGLRPPPRNFTEPVFKFGGVEAGSLPPDAELKRIVRAGLHGTAMLPWQIDDKGLDDALQYIKTFAKNDEGKNNWSEEEVAVPVEITADPWAGKEAEGVKRGKIVYHGLAQCSKCHPAYATKQEIWDAVKEVTGEGSTSAFREDQYNSDSKFSDAYKVKLLPPDFLRHPIKSGSLDEKGHAVLTRRDIFRTIASGIGGTAMPMWKGSIDDADIWAIAYYVFDVYQLQGTPAAGELRNKMLTQAEFIAPAEAAPEGGEGAQPAPEGQK